MIRRLDHMKNLAIVGMSVAFPCGGGINEFGRLIYRGLLLTGKFGEGLTLETTTIKLVRQVCDEAHLLLDQALIVSLSSTTTQILQNSGTNSRLQEVSDVLSAFSLAASCSFRRPPELLGRQQRPPYGLGRRVTSSPQCTRRRICVGFCLPSRSGEW